MRPQATIWPVALLVILAGSALAQAYIYVFGPRLVPIEHYVWFAMRAGVLVVVESVVWAIWKLIRRRG